MISNVTYGFFFPDGVRIFYHQVRTGDVRQSLHVPLVGRSTGNDVVPDFHGLDPPVCRVLSYNGTRDSKTSKDIKTEYMIVGRRDFYLFIIYKYTGSRPGTRNIK